MSLSAAKSSCTEDRSTTAPPRNAFGRFATGVAFVTAEVGDTPLGLIVSSFAAVSLDPPLVSFCPARDVADVAADAGRGRFGVHVLATWHGEFARRAAAPGADRFARALGGRAGGDRVRPRGGAPRRRPLDRRRPRARAALSADPVRSSTSRAASALSTPTEHRRQRNVHVHRRLGELRDHVREMYRDGRPQPGGEFHFETGRALAERLGYPAAWLDAVAGRRARVVRRRRPHARPGRSRPGDTVLDLGSGSGTDAFIAATWPAPTAAWSAST